ncbi:MAG: helix-turn-helix domain-containing protein [Nitratireductor sp.]
MWSSAGASFLAFPATALRQCVASNPEALMRIILEVGNSLRLLIGWSLVSNLFLPEQRLAYALLAISSPREMEITQEQLGAIGLGSRQRVSRLLHSLEARGLVTTGYRSVSITDPDKLGAFAFGKSWRTGINSVLPGFGSK